ncbi:hypothetical protein STEG23_034223, partial [Scotinomys teguina]
EKEGRERLTALQLSWLRSVVFILKPIDKVMRKVDNLPCDWKSLTEPETLIDFQSDQFFSSSDESDDF